MGLIAEAYASSSAESKTKSLSQCLSCSWGISAISRTNERCPKVGEGESFPQFHCTDTSCDTADEGEALAHRLGCKFVESSAKTCVNVEKAYYTVVSRPVGPYDVVVLSTDAPSPREFRSG